MLQTCILDILDAETCDALTDRTDSAEVLRALEAQMPFISALGPEGKAYRYHPLLSDMLRFQLSTRHPGAAQGLALIAAGVLERTVVSTARPPRVEYRLTVAGQRLGALVDAMRAYAAHA